MVVGIYFFKTRYFLCKFYHPLRFTRIFDTNFLFLFCLQQPSSAAAVDGNHNMYNIVVSRVNRAYIVLFLLYAYTRQKMRQLGTYSYGVKIFRLVIDIHYVIVSAIRTAGALCTFASIFVLARTDFYTVFASYLLCAFFFSRVIPRDSLRTRHCCRRRGYLLVNNNKTTIADGVDNNNNNYYFDCCYYVKHKAVMSPPSCRYYSVCRYL